MASRKSSATGRRFECHRCRIERCRTVGMYRAMIIRPLGDRDVAALEQLAIEAETEDFHFVTRFLADVGAANTTFDTPKEFFFGVFDRERLLGFGGVTPDPYLADSVTGRLRHLYVRRDARRRGIGHSLVRALEARASGIYERLRLRTDTDAAAHFYRRLDYQPKRRALRDAYPFSSDSMKFPVALRWILVPAASMVSCSGTVLIADAVGRGASRIIGLDTGRAIESVVAVDVRAGLVYAIGAVAWVIAGTWIAPRHRVAVAPVLYVVGAFLAWSELDGWYFPEGHPRAYQTSRVPLVLTLVGGFLAAAAIMVRCRRGERREAQHDNS
jgi:ribosomal protein S18 acetylase RimI-like enzyme